MNIPTLLGMTENAVYGQLFCALIVYALLNWLFVAAQTSWPQHAVLSFARFSRLFLLQNLPVEWLIQIQHVLLQCTSCVYELSYSTGVAESKSIYNHKRFFPFLDKD
ncbi:hypothetical protein J2T18_004065 [Paenibacillus polymyxa]|uniref:hypothetical protein n=1 Tax=Paenibacillus polymyxa TaxID=1406 RepID=UPI0027937D84|nr:hypothetical protein [Paenibacillus polymyxa]